MKLNPGIAFDIFCMGVDYGQLLMEQERENEEWADAFNCYCVARKTSMPTIPVSHRQVHSEKWFEAKNKSVKEFKKLLYSLYESEKCEKDY